jgi:ABC-type transport system involved in multi-copper enzyme maturation permease subunit
MMRPYLTVIRDSFHEALASRVLWILLAATTVFLLLLLPVGIIQQAGSYLNDEDFIDRGKLVERIVAGGKAKQPSPARHIWELLPPTTKETLLADPSEPFARRMRFNSLEESLRKMLTKPDFYDAAAWAKTRLPSEAQKLEKEGLKSLSAEQLARFNRLALETAFPDLINPAPPKQVQLAYFTWEMGIPLPVEPEQLFPAINQMVVAALSILLGGAGVFVAVLVTASMIPQTFEAGSVDLLLSKPVHRSGLFLAKFFGGCAFIAINAAYFIVGVWLILGFRVGLWNERLLWAIPLYLFLFAIYYGVSSLAGLIWRNAIVSVVLAVVFWFVCFAIGSGVNVVEQLSLNPRRLVRIVPAGESLIAVNQADVFQWDPKGHDWQKIFAGRGENNFAVMFASRLVGPVFDPAGERILAFRSSMPGFAPFGSVNRLLIGSQADDWRRSEGVTVPQGAGGLFVTPKGEVLVAASGGMYRLEGDIAARQQDINVFGVHIPLPQSRGQFVRSGIDTKLRPLVSAALDPGTLEVALFDGTRLVVCAPDEKGEYQLAGEVKFERRLLGEVAIGGGKVYLSLPGGEVRRYDQRLKPLESIDTGINGSPDAVAMSADGRFLAIVFKNARLWLYDVRDEREAALAIAGQGDVSAAVFQGDSLLVADRLTRVSRYDLGELKLAKRWQGAMPLVEKIYRYALYPLYAVFPKPGELNQTVNHVLTSQDTKIGGLRFDEGPRAPAKVDVWGPVWSNLAFLVVVLAISCAYISRRDF